MINYSVTRMLRRNLNLLWRPAQVIASVAVRRLDVVLRRDNWIELELIVKSIHFEILTPRSPFPGYVSIPVDLLPLRDGRRVLGRLQKVSGVHPVN